MDVYLYHGGRWIMDPVLSYLRGDVYIVEDFDVDFLSIISVKDAYKSQLGYKNAEHIYVLEPIMEMNEGLFLIQDDNEIRKVLSKINADIDALELFANHEIDAHVCVSNYVLLGPT